MVLTGSRRLMPEPPSAVSKALAWSLLFHLCLLFTLEIGGRLGWWKHLLRLSLASETEPAREMIVEFVEVPAARTEPTMTFIEVPPTQAAEEAPPEAKLYSSLNSRAANPDPTKNLDVPEIKGTQDKVARTTDSTAPRPVPVSPPPVPAETATTTLPLQPAPRVPEQSVLREQPKLERKDVPAIPKEPGSLAVTQTAPANESASPATPATEPAPVPVRRRPPRTLDQVLLASNPAISPGEKVRQSGGARRNATEASFDVKSTEFGAYDAAVVAAISKRWYDLLEARVVSTAMRGRVVLEFRLNSDGRITDMLERENNVSPELGLICQRAVAEPARYATWPAALRAIVGKDYRQVRFTFYYN